MKIVKRKFTAWIYPKGSKERDLANLNIETSEYQTGQKYAVVGQNVSISFKSREEAEKFIESTYGSIKK